jgi:hypothetical protein
MMPMVAYDKRWRYGIFIVSCSAEIAALVTSYSITQ